MPNYDVTINCDQGTYVTRQENCSGNAEAAQLAVREARQEGRTGVRVVEIEKVQHLWLGYLFYIAVVFSIIYAVAAAVGD